MCNSAASHTQHPSLLSVLQRVTRSSTASPTSPTLMSESGSRNGSWWTCRLSTAGWVWLDPCGSSPPSTSTTRSACRLLHVKVVLFCCCNLLMWSLLFSVVYFFPEVSDTYPADLFVPESATPPVIVGSSKFRSRGRFPTLSYYCRETQVCPSPFSLCSMLSVGTEKLYR